MPDTLTAEQQATADAAAAEKLAADAKAAEAAAGAPDAAKIAADAQAATEKAAADAKAVADAEAAKAAIKYDLKAPDGVTLDPALMERTVAIARAQGLSPEAGQALLDSTVSELQSQDAARTARWEPLKGVDWIAYNNTLKASALADPEIGGSPEKLANNVELAQSVIRTISDGDPKMETAFKNFLTTSGLASHPDAIRLLARIGRRMAEPALILGSTSNTSGKKPMKEAMYPGDGTGPKTTPTTE